MLSDYVILVTAGDSIALDLLLNHLGVQLVVSCFEILLDVLIGVLSGARPTLYSTTWLPFSSHICDVDCTIETCATIANSKTRLISHSTCIHIQLQGATHLGLARLLWGWYGFRSWPLAFILLLLKVLLVLDNYSVDDDGFGYEIAKISYF